MSQLQEIIMNYYHHQETDNHVKKAFKPCKAGPGPLTRIVTSEIKQDDIRFNLNTVRKIVVI